MESYTAALIQYLSRFVTENRLSTFYQVLHSRTRYISILLEDIYQTQNASAVLRTCDCTGIQDVHIVEQRNELEINRDVSIGSHQWLTLHYYRDGADNIYRGIQTLKNHGYRIVATSPHQEGVPPETFNLNRGKAALLFGTELNGLSGRALELADEYMQIPIAGFTESYNISVSAAIILYTLRKRLEVSSLDWHLQETERDLLLLDWLRTSIKMSGQIEKQFRDEYHATF